MNQDNQDGQDRISDLVLFSLRAWNYAGSRLRPGLRTPRKEGQDNRMDRIWSREAGTITR